MPRRDWRTIFDIRLFHNQLLTLGAVPLNLLERLVKSCVDQQRLQIKATQR